MSTPSAPSAPTGAELDEFVRRLAAASPLHAGLLDEFGATVEPVAPPAVLAGATTFDVVIPVRRKPVELRVADVDGDLLVLGSPDRVHDLARRVGLHLDTTDEATAYLRFWCHAALRRTETLVEGPDDFLWIPAVGTDDDVRGRADEVARLARPVDTRTAADDGYVADVTVLDQRTLELREYWIDPAGTVSEHRRDIVAHDAPVPYLLP